MKDLSEGLPLTKAALQTLLKASYIYLLSVTQLYFRYFYSKIAKKKIPLFDTHLVLDLVIFILVIVRVLKYDDTLVSFFDFTNLDKYDNDVRMAYQYLMGAFLTLLWCKLIIYLKFTVSLGPLLRILELIFRKLFWFGVIFFGEMIIMAVIGHILFSFDKNMDDYNTIASSLLTIYKATMQSFSFDGFDDQHTWGNTIYKH